MTTHPYLRAFVSGAFVPTLLLPLMLAAFIVVRLGMGLPFPIERGLVFPLALVPCLWALWNMLWLGSHARTHLVLGVHGMLLPLLLLPGGATVAGCLGILELQATGAFWFRTVLVPYALIVPTFLCVLVGYYLLWKYVVGFVNRELGIG